MKLMLLILICSPHYGHFANIDRVPKAQVSEQLETEVLNRFSNHVAKYLESELEKSNMDYRLKNFQEQLWKGSLECNLCRGFVDGLKILMGTKLTSGCIGALIDYVCYTMKIEDNTVCLGISTEFRTAIIYVVEQLIVEPNEICGLAFKDCGTPFDPLKKNWTLPIPGGKPPITPNSLPKAGSPTLRVLQLSDIHYDKMYAPGAVSESCGEPLCCRAHNGFTGKSPAGYWGTQSNCDLPSWTLERIFQYIKDNVEYDYLIWTGDLPPHNIWNQTSEDQIFNLKQLTQWFQTYFSKKPIIPAVGNHEGAPVDNFPPHTVPEKYSNAWLYNTLASEWINWVPADAAHNISQRAAYSIKPFPGQRVIALNTQYGDHLNFWLYLNETDPDGMMSWLIDELKDAEKEGEKVHIMGHIPPGIPYTLAAWSMNYYEVVNRFESTIAAQFFGHTHDDQFSVFYEGGKAGNRPTSMAYISPSMTTFSHHRPSYRIYTIDGNYPGSSWQVLDTETHVLDLDKLNKENVTQFHLEYSAKASYGMTSLFPSDWDNLIETFRKDESLFNKYVKFFHHNDDTYETSCDCSCKFDKLCQMRSSKSYASQDFCSDLNPCQGMVDRKKRNVLPSKEEILKEKSAAVKNLVNKFIHEKAMLRNGEGTMKPSQLSWYGHIIDQCLKHEN
jgi:sphingomyelin phosphodiesterase